MTELTQNLSAQSLNALYTKFELHPHYTYRAFENEVNYGYVTLHLYQEIMSFKVPSLKEVAFLQTSKFFWNAGFKTENMQIDELKFDVEQRWDNQLLSCRKKTVKILNNFITNKTFPAKFQNSMTDLIISLHKSFRHLFLWKIAYDPSNRISLLEEGELYAPKFFTRDGDFEDISWVQHFVRDPNYLLIDRFGIACCFCLENESEILWLDLRRLHGSEIAEEKNFFKYFKDHLSIISHRILMLEQQLSGLEHIQHEQESYWKRGFEIAVSGNYEHAVYYFWGKLSDNDKLQIMNNITYFESMAKNIDYPRDKITYFLFSQLPDNRKRQLFSWSVSGFRFEMWYNLLISPFAKALQSEINSFCNQLPSEMCVSLLKYLERRVIKLQFPCDLQTFLNIWRNMEFEKQLHILKCGVECAPILARAKTFNDLSCLIKNLSYQDKRKCLLSNLYKAGITVLDILSEEKEFDMFKKYMNCFLMEIDLYTQTEILRKDGSILLQKFLESDDYKKWCEEENFRENKKEIINIIDSVKNSFNSS